MPRDGRVDGIKADGQSGITLASADPAQHGDQLLPISVLTQRGQYKSSA